MANFDVKIKTPKRVEKQWGHELWIHNDSQYCGKLLVFTNSGNKFSMHYHMLKNETWYVQEGAFQFDWIDTESAERCYTQLQKGDVVYIEKGLPHQLTALIDNSIVFEVSTEHFDDDSYRIYRKGPQDLE
jgi:mannose-6-phosphate isomerase-like protein (cupin superfamily)